MKTITVTIPQFGAPKVEAEGFDGEGCESATAPIERALSRSGAADVAYKPEWQNADSTETEEQTVQW